jgi:hypothetical protein
VEKELDGMRKFVALMLLLVTMAPFAGCETKEDPRERPDFVDTSDPNKVQMPPTTAPAKP